MQRQTTLDFFKYSKRSGQRQTHALSQQNQSIKSDIHPPNGKNNSGGNQLNKRSSAGDNIVEEITLDSPPPKKTAAVTPSTSCAKNFDLGNFFSDSDDEMNDDDNDDQALLNLAIEHSLRDSKRKGLDNLEQNVKNDFPIENLDGFDLEAGKTWIYPINKPLRQYQFEISRTCLFNNTLVTLPTGLGKTFIAAVVMYNFYRWYPEGKIIFMAPTKPLVAQQIEACYELMSINQDDIAEMTGTTQPSERLAKWQDKRIFFLTPQIIANDLVTNGSQMNPDKIKCLVIDEAHKATGNYAYCQVVRELLQYTQQFRIVALSATPGRAAKAVQQVITNLLIGKLEIRSDDSPEIRQYAHNRNIEKVIVPLDDNLKYLEDLYVKTLEKYTKPLVEAGFLINMDPRKFSKYGLLQEREKMRNKAVGNKRRSFGIFEYYFACSMTLCHGLELLSFYGQRTLYFYLKGQMDELSKMNTRFRHDLERDESFMELMHILTERFGPMHNNTQATRISDMVTSHPKLLRLVEIAVNHFEQFASKNMEAETSSTKTETRIIIFSQYRESVEEITAILRKHQPLIRPMKFIGQSFSAGKTTKGLTQKEQLRVMKEFKAGNYNTIVATCVAEEGLDIAEVDLIICYDAPKSPIRLVQRMGRTGRKRLGRIVVLLTKGREENCFDRSEHSKNSVYKNILQIDKFEVSPHNPRMIPLGLTPRCEKKVMEQLKPFENAKGKRKGRKGDAQPTLDSFLSDQQLKEWKNQLLLSHGVSEWSKICENSLKFTFRRLASDETGILQSFGQRYDVNQYYLWQNESQKSFGIGHSTKSSLLVDLSKKCQYLSRLAEEGDFDPDEYYFVPDFDSFYPRTVPALEKLEPTLLKENKAPSIVENSEVRRDPNLDLKALYYGIEFSNLKTLCAEGDSCDAPIHDFVNFEIWREKRQILRETANKSCAIGKESSVCENQAIDYCPSTISRPNLAEKSSNLDITFDFNLCTSLDDMFNDITDHCFIDNEPQSAAKPDSASVYTSSVVRPSLSTLSPICHTKSVPKVKGTTPMSHIATKKWSTPKAPQTSSSTFAMVDLENFDEDFSFDFGLDDASQKSISSPLPSSSNANQEQVACRLIPLERISDSSSCYRPTTPVSCEKENVSKMVIPATPEHLLAARTSLKQMSNDDSKKVNPNSVTFVASQSPILRRRDNLNGKPLAHVKPYRINDTILADDVVQSKRKFRKNLQGKYGNEFIVSEADISLAGCSQISIDESDSDVEMENVEAIDCYDENDSFVDANTQPEYLNTQRRVESPSEMRAIYLKSINNSVMCGRRNKFKLVYDPANDRNKKTENHHNEPENDENQAGTSRDYNNSTDMMYSNLDETDFEDRLSDDSFVVPNDFVEFMTQTQKPKKKKKTSIEEKPKRNDKDSRATKRLKLCSSSSESDQDS